MTTNAKDVLNAALALPLKKRAEIADRLLQSLDDPRPDATEQAEIDAAWAKEIDRRVREIDEGRAELIPAEDVFAEVAGVIMKIRAAKKRRK
jgi:putative addiction module component (TIGR02574 family)